MPVSDTQLAALESALTRQPAPPLAELRSQFPGLAILQCDPEDMDQPAYRSGEHYQLYLINRSQVCISLTDQPEQADGVVVTRR